MKIALRKVAAMLGVEVESDAMVTGWSIDSRTVQPGDLFFALRGPNHDGHAYVAEVLKKGAVGVVADREVEGDCIAGRKFAWGAPENCARWRGRSGAAISWR